MEPMVMYTEHHFLELSIKKCTKVDTLNPDSHWWLTLIDAWPVPIDPQYTILWTLFFVYILSSMIICWYACGQPSCFNLNFCHVLSAQGGCILKISEVKLGQIFNISSKHCIPGDPTNCRPALLTQKDWHLILFYIWCCPLRLSSKFWPNCSRAWPYYMIFQTHSGLYLQCATEIGRQTFSFESCGVFALKKV